MFPRSVNRRGLTLLELLIASALAVILAGTTGALLLRGLNAARQGGDFLRQSYLVERAVERLGRELGNAVPSAEGPFTGTEGELAFLMAEGPAKLASVRYHLTPSGDGKVLTREWQPFPPDGNPTQQPLLGGVVNFSVLYGMISEQDGVRVPVWSKEWKGSGPPASVPGWVLIRLESRDPRGRSYSVTREFLFPQGVLQESVR